LELKRLVGFGADGASVMSGCKSGVAVRLKEWSPSLIARHAIVVIVDYYCHRQ